GHCTPHAPQLKSSVFVSTHEPLHAVRGALHLGGLPGGLALLSAGEAKALLSSFATSTPSAGGSEPSSPRKASGAASHPMPAYWTPAFLPGRPPPMAQPAIASPAIAIDVQFLRFIAISFSAPLRGRGHDCETSRGRKLWERCS